jgi:hypothetical protein
MPVICCNLAALAIAVLFYSWRDGYLCQLQRHRVLRERVAYMLWVAAERAA